MSLPPNGDGPRLVLVLLEEVSALNCELCTHALLAHDIDGNCDDCELSGGVCHPGLEPEDERIP